MSKTSPFDMRLKRVLQIHFDAEHGTRYWLDRQKELAIDALQRVRCVEDLAILGPTDEAVLAERPIEDFIPQAFHRHSDYVLAETAGTLGRPKTAVHRADEFETAFVTPFVKAARRVGFPRGGHWLFIGPTGPHIIGRAARRCAKALGAADAFTVDFDPRWAKKLPTGSFAAQRYLEHIQEQALGVLEIQTIEVLFVTPAVLTGLTERISKAGRMAIRGIHLGGMTASADFMARTADMFPNAVILSGYGNTLLGMMPQLQYSQESGFDYFPYGDRLIVNLIPPFEEGDAPDIAAHVDYGRRGRVMAHRLDEMQFLPNLIERDTAVRIPPLPEAASDGFVQDGLRDPQPIISETVKPAIGLY